MTFRVLAMSWLRTIKTLQGGDILAPYKVNARLICLSLTTMGEFSDHVVYLLSRAAAEQVRLLQCLTSFCRAYADCKTGRCHFWRQSSRIQPRRSNSTMDHPIRWALCSIYTISQLIYLYSVLIVGMTQLLAVFLSHIRQPRVIAEVIGGVLLGPSVMGHIPGFSNTIFPTDSLVVLTATANIGLILFLFLVALEIDTRLLKRNIVASAAVSIAGLVIPLALGAALGVGVYREFISDTVNFGYFLLFVAVAIGITAFPVLCRILTELKLLDTEVGLITLSAGIGNDVVGWILLALTVALVNASTGLTALYVLLVCTAYTIFLLYPGRWAFRWLAQRTGSLEQGSPTPFMMTITLLVVFISAFFTDIIGVHAIFGNLPRFLHLSTVLNPSYRGLFGGSPCPP